MVSLPELGGLPFAGEVSGKDLFLEAAGSVGDALEIIDIGHCGGNRGVLIARVKDGIGCGCPISVRNVGSVSYRLLQAEAEDVRRS